MKKNYYLGLDIGTNSVGYAVTDEQFLLLKHKGEPMWGSHVFEEGKQCAERRAYRTARRRLDRRQQRVYLTQQIFAREISKMDERFFVRLKESALFREDTSGNDTYIFFQDQDYTDVDYHREYPTIHHLIVELMEDDSPHDVRLVYLAVAWLMAHRGHFLSEVSKDNIKELLDFDGIYESFMALFPDKPWECDDMEQFKKILLTNQTVRDKERKFWDLLNGGKKPTKRENDVLAAEGILKLLSGGTVEAGKLFCGASFEEKISINLRKSEEEFQGILSELGEEEAEYLKRLRAIFDWSFLIESLHGCASVSEAKVKDYIQHGKDLRTLKYLVRKYCPEQYNRIFREMEPGNYAAYVYNLEKGKRNKEYKKITKEGFCDYVKKKLKNISCDPEDEEILQEVMLRLETYSFMPKQVNGDNRVIPYQLYYYELKRILDNAENYLPFLKEAEDGISNKAKLLSIFEFRIPYYVGPLCSASTHAWIRRKGQGKIYPWNFEEQVDLDGSEEAFINRMTNNCTYLPGENVVPKDSLLYCKFMVLNEINNIKINGNPISAACKQELYELFLRNRKVTVEGIRKYLISNNYMARDEVLGGIDVTVKASLKPYHDFKRLMQSGVLCETQVERIIEILPYSEERGRILYRLQQEFPKLPEEDRKYIAKLKYDGFARLSRRFLTELQGVNKETGELCTIMQALWDTNDNMMQLLSDRYTFREEIALVQKEYYADHPLSVESLLEEMYVSNAVKRPIYRTLSIVQDIQSVCGAAPEKIFVEMARWKEEDKTRKASRKDQIRALYKGMDQEEVRELSRQLEGTEERQLRSEVLFLYFMQLGRSMYSGKTIDINRLKTDAYNVDHIYPQCRVKDDSLSNKVLVLSEENGAKGDRYPIDPAIQNNMAAMWKSYHDRGLISDEKYRRLTRRTPFSDAEKMDFINRQMVETQQSTKAVTKIFQFLYPDTQIVYVKAGLVSELRQVLECVKSRSVNDLHHAKDAYLNIVAGEVYHTRFSEKYFKVDRDEYSVKAKVIFGGKVWRGKDLVWDGGRDIARVKQVMGKNCIHYTRYAFERKGGLFDQQPVRAAENLVERKAGLDTGKYGGYNSTTATYFLLAGYTETAKKPKKDIMFLPVELLETEQINGSEQYAAEYAAKAIAQITGRPREAIGEINFPLGLRHLKVNTLLSLDGFLVSIVGKSSGGKQVTLGSMTPLIVDGEKEAYIKKLKNFSRKKKENSLLKADEEYDGISREKNGGLYRFFVSKLEEKPFSIPFAGQLPVLQKGEEQFAALTVEEQVTVLLNLLSLFQTGRTTGCNLSAIGGAANAGVFINSSKLSNWKKSYQQVRIVDVSSAGLHRTVSGNLLELL